MTPDQNSALHVDFCGMHFQTPLVLLSGCVGFGEEYTRVEGFSNRDVGAVCLKGTTGELRPGNMPHRVYETPGGMLNAIGLQNPGVDSVVKEILPTLDFSESRFIANVSGSTIEEYIEVTRKFDDSPIDAIEINSADLRIDTFRASGAGGQHVNKTDSAIRITHLPSGAVVECQDQRSQHKNKARAMALLQTRLLDQAQQAAHDERSEERKLQVGSGDRSGRIRTYNFPQNRVTDHRINLTLYKLDDILEGGLDQVIGHLHTAIISMNDHGNHRFMHLHKINHLILSFLPIRHCMFLYFFSGIGQFNTS